MKSPTLAALEKLPNVPVTVPSWEELRDDLGEPRRQKERDRIQKTVDLAEHYLDEGWTDDDVHTGIIYQRGTDNCRRVPVQVYMMMKALVLGMGIAIERQMERDS